jgi:hypothetical protein
MPGTLTYVGRAEARRSGAMTARSSKETKERRELIEGTGSFVSAPGPTVAIGTWPVRLIKYGGPRVQMNRVIYSRDPEVVAPAYRTRDQVSG